MTQQKIIKLVTTNDRGLRVGETHPKAKHSDAVVDRVRDMREHEGMKYMDIAKAMGLPKSVVADWCQYLTRAQTYYAFKRVEVGGTDTSENMSDDIAHGEKATDRLGSD